MPKEAWPHTNESTERRKLDRFPHLKSLILTNEAYLQHPFAQSREGKRYTYEIESGGKKISYIGSNHSKDPSDPQFDEIQQTFEQLEPDMVYVEGKEGIEKRKDELKISIRDIDASEFRKFGEGTFTVKLALDNDSDFESPEPPFRIEIDYLESKSFTRQEIFNFYTYRQIYQFQRENSGKSATECVTYLERYIPMFFQSSGWDTAELERYKEDLVGNLDIHDMRKYADQVDPIPWEGKPQNVYNQISRCSNTFRDEFALERIALGLETHDRVLVVFGSAHAVRLEPALRELMTQFDTLNK